MSIDTTSNYSSTGSTTESKSSSGDAYNDLTTSDFIKMMVAELQYQDPMSPMDNSQMISQISQLRSISSNDKLAATLENVVLGQTFATASSLIGKTVTGKSEAGTDVTDKVERVVFENGSAKIYVGNSIIKLENITAIKDSAETS